MTKRILITGGTGYIGSHTAIDLIQNGYEVLILDSLVRSDAKTIDRIEAITGVRPQFIQLDLCDLEALDRYLSTQSTIDGIIHFAAYKYVDESVQKPLIYFQNNLTGQLNIMQMAEKYGIKAFVFSSSCSVYGNIERLPVTETTPMMAAQSPYARTKQIGEMMIEDASRSGSVSYVSLRYFNPVGAHESGKIGESPSVTPNNLVPRITGTAVGKYPELQVFGTDLPTRDGSCIRDYIHIMDLAEAHTAALTYLLNHKNEKKHEIFNIGSGDGVSVLEAIAAFEKVSGKKLNVKYAPPRPGDVIAIYSDCSHSMQKLNWKAQRDIYTMMKSAWMWELADK